MEHKTGDVLEITNDSSTLTYETGDIVVEHGDNMPMAVESVKGGMVTCKWFQKDAEGKYIMRLTGTFLPSDLDMVHKHVKMNPHKGHTIEFIAIVVVMAIIMWMSF